jgi:hypothetical protein
MAPTARNVKLLVYGIGLACILFGGGTIAVANWVFGFSGESAYWPEATGTVLSSHIRTHSPKSRNVRIQTRYYPEITYTYRVDKKLYTSSRYALARSATMFRERDDAVAYQEQNFPIRSAVKVYYNPENPAEAVLDPTRDPDGWQPFAFGGFFILMGLGIMVMGIFEGRRADAKEQAEVAPKRPGLIPPS